MIYMGSKNRIAKHILPIMLKERGDRTWVEPFVGGANMIDKVDGGRIGADFNPYLIEALKLIRDTPESLPDHVSEDEYKYFKNKKDINGLTGWVGFVCSFGGSFFNTYARKGEGRHCALEGKKNALKQSPNLKGVTFIESNYKDLEIPPNSLIYCDPPYENTSGYFCSFDHAAFWDWCRGKHREGHKVFISEYIAPDDFQCIWQGEIKTNFSSTRKAATHNAIEKLFIFDDMY